MIPNTKALILNYHLIDDGTDTPDALGGIYAVREADFLEQMHCLQENGIEVVSLTDLLENRVTADFCVAITFDDGQSSDYMISAPLLKTFGFTATFFLSRFHMEKNQCDWDKYKEMLSDGFGIGSHGIQHVDLTSLNKAELKKELENSKSWLEDQLKQDITLFALPFGKCNNSVASEAVNSGYQGIFSTAFEIIRSRKHSFVLGRWSIKRNTSISDFRKIIHQTSLTVFKHRSVSRFKKKVHAVLGTRLVNKINVLKNNY